MRAWLAANAPGLEILPLINNYNSEIGAWDGRAAGELLSSAASRARLIEGLLGYVKDGKFTGIVIDLEKLTGTDTKLSRFSFVSCPRVSFHKV